MPFEGRAEGINPGTVAMIIIATVFATAYGVRLYDRLQVWHAQYRQEGKRRRARRSERGADRSELTTERLSIRVMRKSDVQALHVMLSDEVVMRWQSEGPNQRLAETKADMAAMLKDDGRQCWMIFEEKGPAIGWISIAHQQDGLQHIGYMLATEARGRGIATEALDALLDHSFRFFGARRIQAGTDPENLASIRLLERLGFTREGHFRKHRSTHNGVRDSLLYAILREEWQQRSAG